jgi:hypothetical protein
MNRLHTIGRLAVILAGLAGSLLAFIASTGPAAFAASLGGAPHGRPGLIYGHPALASPPPGPPGWNKHPPLPAHAHTLVTGMPGWQIALIVAGAALLGAALAVLVYRTRTARRRVTVSAA